MRSPDKKPTRNASPKKRTEKRTEKPVVRKKATLIKMTDSDSKTKPKGKKILIIKPAEPKKPKVVEVPRERRTNRPETRKNSASKKPTTNKTYQREDQREDKRNSLHPGERAIRLNKYIANAGICSRRDADKLIESGVIKVNGKPVTELGTKVYPGDVVQYNQQKLKGETLRYVLLNKPKGFICTVEDPQDRRTVMELVKNACAERIYPVGRLDRNTTGLLLLTNDGDLAKKLTHPRHQVKKVYQVELDKPLAKNDLVALSDGVELEDGFIAPDAIAYAEHGDDKTKIGIEIHSGRNRIVRRMFEKFGYEVVKLDRTVLANLNKKDLPRGKWRHLTLTEINILRRVQ